MINFLDPTRPIVNKQGKMEDAFRIFTRQISETGLIVGEGSPEGVVVAEIGREYMDLIGTAGSIKYIKRDDNIAGDKTKGWILI